MLPSRKTIRRAVLKDNMVYMQVHIHYILIKMPITVEVESSLF